MMIDQDQDCHTPVLNCPGLARTLRQDVMGRLEHPDEDSDWEEGGTEDSDQTENQRKKKKDQAPEKEKDREMKDQE